MEKICAENPEKNGAGNVAIWDKFSEQNQHKSYNLSYNDLTLGAVSVSYSQSRILVTCYF